VITNANRNKCNEETEYKRMCCVVLGGVLEHIMLSPSLLYYFQSIITLQLYINS
jgi:hypothetical protein